LTVPFQLRNEREREARNPPDDPSLVDGLVLFPKDQPLSGLGKLRKTRNREVFMVDIGVLF
jgi:hypothetical protein